MTTDAAWQAMSPRERDAVEYWRTPTSGVKIMEPDIVFVWNTGWGQPSKKLAANTVRGHAYCHQVETEYEAIHGYREAKHD